MSTFTAYLSKEEQKQVKSFLDALEENDFAEGDSFWIGLFEFEVVSVRGFDETAEEFEKRKAGQS